MKENHDSPMHTIGIIMGIFAAIVAIIGVALAGFVYIDNTYAKKTPKELTKIIDTHKKRLDDLSENNKQVISKISKDFDNKILTILNKADETIQRENKKLTDLYSSKDKELKTLLFAMEAISEKSLGKQSEIFDKYLNKNKKFNLYIDDKINSFLNNHIIVKNANLSIDIEGNLIYYKTLSNNIYIDGRIRIDSKYFNEIATLFTLEKGYRPFRNQDISTKVSTSTKDNKLTIIIDTDGRVQAKLRSSNHDNDISINFSTLLAGRAKKTL